MHTPNRLLAALVLLPLLSLATGARVCIEAESAITFEAPMLVVTQAVPPAGIKVISGASNEAYIEIPEGRGNPPAVMTGKAVITLNIPTENAYTIWCRVYWEGECSNSFNVQIDERPVFLLGEDATFKTWHWVRYPVTRTAAPVVLTKGSHTFTFLNREDGVRLDQILLSADKRFVPIELEPVGTKP